MSQSSEMFSLCVVALLLGAGAAAHAEVQGQVVVSPAKLPPGAVQTRANGRIELHPEAHSPLAVEFERSASLTRALADAMQAKGFVIAQD